MIKRFLSQDISKLYVRKQNPITDLGMVTVQESVPGLA